MSEFCFDCYKEYFDENAKIERLKIDKEPDLCEGCGEFKPIVMGEKPESFLSSFVDWLKRIKSGKTPTLPHMGGGDY